MGKEKEIPGYRPVKNAHKALGLWSIGLVLTLAFTVAVILLVISWFLISWILGSPPQAKPKPLETKDQLELLKLVFALVAGVGAVVALVTAYRRQRVDEAAGERAERVQAHVEYGQAIELIGHDKAAVRLGGLHSLDRLGQDHPFYRQTVIDVICSYLRMPFKEPPVDTDQIEPFEGQELDEVANEARQELQVRLTAQRLIKRHLTTSPSGKRHLPTYWEGINIDLTGACLIDFDFIECHPKEVNFSGAKFIGDTEFSEAQFGGDAWFYDAQFIGDVWFDGAQFNEGAWFGGYAGSDGAHFNGVANFAGAQFNRVQFNDMKFGIVNFDRAQFHGAADFESARFHSAKFRNARFIGSVNFKKARFGQVPDFTGATASYPNEFHVWPSPWRAQPDSPATDTAHLTRETDGNGDGSVDEHN